MISGSKVSWWEKVFLRFGEWNTRSSYGNTSCKAVRAAAAADSDPELFKKMVTSSPLYMHGPLVAIPALMHCVQAGDLGRQTFWYLISLYVFDTLLYAPLENPCDGVPMVANYSPYSAHAGTPSRHPLSATTVGPEAQLRVLQAMAAAKLIIAGRGGDGCLGAWSPCLLDDLSSPHHRFLRRYYHSSRWFRAYSAYMIHTARPSLTKSVVSVALGLDVHPAVDTMCNDIFRGHGSWISPCTVEECISQIRAMFGAQTSCANGDPEYRARVELVRTLNACGAECVRKAFALALDKITVTAARCKRRSSSASEDFAVNEPGSTPCTIWSATRPELYPEDFEDEREARVWSFDVSFNILRRLSEIKEAALKDFQTLLGSLEGHEVCSSCFAILPKAHGREGADEFWYLGVQVVPPQNFWYCQSCWDWWEASEDEQDVLG